MSCVKYEKKHIHTALCFDNNNSISLEGFFVQKIFKIVLKNILNKWRTVAHGSVYVCID